MKSASYSQTRACHALQESNRLAEIIEREQQYTVTPYLRIDRLCRRVLTFARAHVSQLGVDSGKAVRESLFEGLEVISGRWFFVPWCFRYQTGGKGFRGSLASR